MAKKSSVKNKTIKIDYSKTSDYRVIAADGALGHWTPRKKLFLELYVEHVAVPDQVEHQLTETGQLGEMVTPQTGMVCWERQVGILLDRQIAENLHALLGSMLKSTSDEYEK
jgi:hypothetical protein